MKKWIYLFVLALATLAKAHQFDGSQTAPVHRIPLTDEAGEKIIPTLPDAMPISTKNTCGACHNYEKIHKGFHFSGTPLAKHPTEPWIIVNESIGLQIPESLVKLSDWEFTKRFGRNLLGGGRMNPTNKLTDPNARWDISGGVEINCFACHNQSFKQDHTEWVKQIARENFRWAATAASGIGEVSGMASRLPNTWNIYMGENPDDHVFAVPPEIKYDTTQFDSKYRAWLNIGKPNDSSCLQCHSATPTGVQRHLLPTDVHTAAGLKCVDCHRNGEDHQMLRPFDALQCEDCHLQTGRTPGRLGAPIAAHKGIPPVHFKKISCTACHSGLAPGKAPHLIRTSRANRLGIHGRAQWFTESPFIVEPVMVRNKKGQITPTRMMWPAYWADQTGKPIPEKIVQKVAKGILDAPQKVAQILKTFSMAEDAPGEPLYATNGKLYRSNIDGGLDLIGKTTKTQTWLWETPSNIVAISPAFTVTTNELDSEIEDQILNVLEAFKPQKIILVKDKKQFYLDEDDYLVSTNSTLKNGWYTFKGEPLVSPFVQKAVIDLVGTTKQLNEEQLVQMLKKLGPGTSYITAGRKFSLNANGKLIDTADAAANPIFWPFAHNVRPATQSLGANDCQDCHSANAPFLFSKVTATTPLLTDRIPSIPMHKYEELNRIYHQLFGLSFKVRTIIKTLFILIAGFLILLLLTTALATLTKRIPQANYKHPFSALSLKILLGALLIQAFSGFVLGSLFNSTLNGFPLLLHVSFGLLYAFALAIWGFIHAKSENNFWFWVLIISGILLISSILLAMFPILNTQGQRIAVGIHAMAALSTLIAFTAFLIKKRKQKNALEKKENSNS